MSMLPPGAGAYQQGVGGVTSYSPGPSGAGGVTARSAPPPVHAALLHAASAALGHAQSLASHAALLHTLGQVHANPNPIIMSGIGYQHGTAGHPVVSDFPNPAYDPSRGVDDVYGPARYNYAAYQNAINRDSGMGRMR